MTADAETERDVIAALNGFYDAYAKRDLAGIVAFLAPEPDLIIFGTGVDEKRIGLRAVVAQLERDWSQSEALWMELRWTSVSAAGEVAWVSAEGVGHWRTQDDEGTIPLRMSVIFLRRNEKWLMVHSHASAPLAGQAEGESLPTSIETIEAAVQREQPDLRPQAAPDGTVTLLFTDIEGSTALNERLGDHRWLELLRAHNAIVREHVRAYAGYEVKTAGDGFMVAFSSARRATQCAIDIQRAIATHGIARPDQAIQVRAGLHTGEPIKEADDFFGKQVALAARIASQATGGEILVSALVRELMESGGDIDFGPGRTVGLKGLSGTYHVYDVHWRPS